MIQSKSLSYLQKVNFHLAQGNRSAALFSFSQNVFCPSTNKFYHFTDHNYWVQIFLCLEAFKCNTTSDWLNRMV